MHHPQLTAVKTYKMDIEEEILLLMLLQRKKQSKSNNTTGNRQYWVHPDMVDKNKGYFRQFYPQLRNDENKFFDYFRMSKETFDYLLRKLGKSIKRNDTNMRQSISAEERLAITIRYLSTNTSFKDIHLTYKLGCATVHEIIRNVCLNLWSELKDEYMPKLTKERWKEIAKGFEKDSNFPNCLGVVEGIHIKTRPSRVKNSKNSVSSIVLLAACDSNSYFTHIDVNTSDKTKSVIWKDNSLERLLQDDILDIPEPEPVGVETNILPYTFVGKKTFTLSSHILRPYKGKQVSMKKRVFNYRLSRAHTHMSSALGLLTNKWRVLRKPLNVYPEFAMRVIKACIILHNVVLKRDGYVFEDTLSMPDYQSFSNDIDLQTESQKNIRNNYSAYFESDEGKLSFQYDRIL